MITTNVSKNNILLPGFRSKKCTLHGKRTNHNISFHRPEFNEKQEIVVDIPRLSNEDVIIPGSLNFCFDFNISGTKSWFKNNFK